MEQQSSIIDKLTHVLEDTRHAGYICCVEEAEQTYKRYKEPVRLYRSFLYGAECWKTKRRMVVCVSVPDYFTG
ncbi:hypothetical protein [Massilibacteroides sp.]|uniref:hypothetical protein n=1 Tax=Massilibacteroides sp. TaxID=2034766 RepID=UPI00262E0079|nr:hypothetical protein [Massilibacteroides sp.]MDD4514247.1 hypothetical protein [Massilibacteroides sp.]